MMAKNNHVSLRRSSSHWSRLVRGGVIRFGFYFLLSALSFVFLYPFIKMITQSLMTDDDLINITVKWLPSKLTWSNYAVAYRKLMFKSYVWNSARVAIICTLGHVLSCAMTGYAFARYKFRFKGALFAMVILTMLVPVQTVIIPQYMQFSNWGWLNSEYYLPLVVPSFLGFGLNGAFFIFLFRQFFSGMPYEMEEAARVDGAGEFRTFFQVSLPLLAPGIVTTALFTIVATWNNYFLPLIMLKDSNWYPLTIGLNQWKDQASTAGGQAIQNLVVTGSLITIVPLVIAFLCLQKYWQSGLAAGAVKE